MLAWPGREWVQPREARGQRFFDAVIVGGGQCGLATAFGLMRERVMNVLVLDENEVGEKTSPNQLPAHECIACSGGAAQTRPTLQTHPRPRTVAPTARSPARRAPG